MYFDINQPFMFGSLSNIPFSLLLWLRLNHVSYTNVSFYKRSKCFKKLNLKGISEDQFIKQLKFLKKL